MDENGIEYDDNDSRAIFYARGVLETVKKSCLTMRMQPHCWQSISVTFTTCRHSTTIRNITITYIRKISWMPCIG